jgi:hypothetical protein
MGIPEKEDLIDDGDAAAKEDWVDANLTVAQKLAVEKYYRNEARSRYPGDGDPEIDGGAPVSLGGDPGAYVQAWVWVYNPDCTACGERIKVLKEIPKDEKHLCPKCKKEASDGEGD